jgi:ribosomal protein S18 acetylase RimI-like enzyme
MIRAATADDLDAVYGLIRQLSRHEFTQEQFRDCYKYNNEKGRVLVYEKDNSICGCIVWNIHYPLHFSRKTAEIVNFVVDESCRGQGIGKELLRAVELIAIENGCACIEADSGKHREDAHRFYEREGFGSNHYKFTKGLL